MVDCIGYSCRDCPHGCIVAIVLLIVSDTVVVLVLLIVSDSSGFEPL